MTSSIQTPAGIVNLALGKLGHPRRVGNLYDGSEEAKAALDFYGQTRDNMLRDETWEFSKRQAAPTLLKQAPANGYVGVVWNPAYPPLPWFFEYGYPADCLRVWSVRPPPLQIPNFDPQHYVFGIENDNSLNPAQKVICCNVASAVVTYAGRVTDPTTWEPDFVEALAAAMARRLGRFAASPDMFKLAVADEPASAQAGLSVRG